MYYCTWHHDVQTWDQPTCCNTFHTVPGQHGVICCMSSVSTLFASSVTNQSAAAVAPHHHHYHWRWDTNFFLQLDLYDTIYYMNTIQCATPYQNYVKNY